MEVGKRAHEYRSERMIGNLPLVHVAIGGRDGQGRYRLGLARGIFAFGDLAFGLVAVGGVAFGLVGVGGVAFGVAAMAGVAVGFAAMGAVAIGLVAVGVIAIGLTSYGVIEPTKAATALPLSRVAGGSRPRRTPRG